VRVHVFTRDIIGKSLILLNNGFLN